MLRATANERGGRRMKDAISLIQQAIKETEQELARLKQAEQALTGTHTNGRASAYWARMTPEERRAEMAKRRAKMSPAGRRKLSLMMRKRWAEFRRKKK